MVCGRGIQPCSLKDRRMQFIIPDKCVGCYTYCRRWCRWLIPPHWFKVLNVESALTEGQWNHPLQSLVGITKPAHSQPVTAHGWTLLLHNTHTHTHAGCSWNDVDYPVGLHHRSVLCHWFPVFIAISFIAIVILFYSVDMNHFFKTILWKVPDK